MFKKPFFLVLCILAITIPMTGQSQVTRQELSAVFDIYFEIYTPRLNEGERIKFNHIAFEGQPDWLDYDVFRASYHYGPDYDGNHIHYVWIFGGVLTADFMTVDGLGLLMCHEFGHGFAGPPYKVSGSSTEGQADYYSTGRCLDDFFDRWPLDQSIEEHYSDYPVEVLELCDYDLRCLRKMRAIETRMGDFYYNEDTITSLLDRDESIVDIVETDDWYYPSQQCRVDTYIAGALELPRPSCWYAPGTYSLTKKGN